MTRLFAVVYGAFVLWLAGAGTAYAHGDGGPAPTNWLSTLDTVAPALPGVSIRLVDDYVELTNGTGTPVTVLGYDGEPYLEISSSGVRENALSPATYLNQTRDGRTPLPSTVDASAPPSWREVARSGSYRWHDHRTHWMEDSPPPLVTSAPEVRHLVAEWTLELRSGTTPVTVSGRLEWVPAPAPWPWTGIAVLLAAVAWVCGGLAGWHRPVAALLGGLTVLNIVHVLAGPVGGSLDLVPSVIAWVVAAYAVWTASRRRPAAPYVVAIAAGLLLVLSGVGDLADLGHSQLPFRGPAWLDRLSVAAALGLGTGLLLAGWRVWRREQPLPPRVSADAAS